MREFDLIAVLDGTHSTPPLPSMQMVVAEGLTAVLSAVPRPVIRLPQSRRNHLLDAATRLGWQEACMTLATTLPAGQNCALTLPGAARFLAANRPFLADLLGRFAGLVQVQVTVSWQAQGVLKRFCHEPELAPIFARGATDAADLTNAVRSLAARLGTMISDRLAAAAVDTALLPVTEDVLWNGAILVPQRAIMAVDTAVQAIDAIWPEGLLIRQIGPAPVGSFALLQLEKVSPRQFEDALHRFGMRTKADFADLAAARRGHLMETAAQADPALRELIRRQSRLVQAAARLDDPARGFALCHCRAEGLAESQAPRPVQAVA